MDEFTAMAEAAVQEEFEALTKFVDSQTPEWRAEYAAKNPVRIWMVAGPSEDHSIAISAN